MTAGEKPLAEKDGKNRKLLEFVASQVRRRCIAGVSQVYRRCIAGVSQVFRGCRGRVAGVLPASSALDECFVAMSQLLHARNGQLCQKLPESIGFANPELPDIISLIGVQIPADSRQGRIFLIFTRVCNITLALSANVEFERDNRNQLRMVSITSAGREGRTDVSPYH